MVARMQQRGNREWSCAAIVLLLRLAQHPALVLAGDDEVDFARMQQALPHWRVREAMRYGQPALLPALDALAAEGVSRIVVLPLYPQYSTTTTASIEDVLHRWQARNP